MNEEEIQEALKITKEPITVNSIEYKYFDQENYEKLLSVYENCMWFISNAEQFMQNFKNQQQELDQYKNKIEYYENFEINKTIDKIRLKNNKEIKELHQKLDQCKNNWEELKKYLIEESKFDEYKDITYRETMGYVLDKMKELEEDK